jgi:hypothetical protein
MDQKYYKEKRISKCYFAGKSEKRFVEGKKLRAVVCDSFLWSANWSSSNEIRQFQRNQFWFNHFHPNAITESCNM